MDAKQKQSVLTQLAKTEGDAAQAALLKEANKISAALISETRYDAIEDQIALLGTFAWRVPEKAFDILGDLLAHLPTTELTHEPIGELWVSEDEKRRLNHRNSLIIKAMEVLERICFHNPELDKKILRIFLEATTYEEASVKKAANINLASMAGYRFDIWNVTLQDGCCLGPQPQAIIVEFMGKLNNNERKKYHIGIATLCKALLSPTIGGATFTYNKMTFQQSTLPASNEIKKIRQDVLSLLESIYTLAETTDEKKLIINTLHVATHTPPLADYGADVRTMISTDTMTILETYGRFLSAEDDLQVIQHIEHTAYHDYKRSGNEDVRAAALKIRDAIAQNQEYQIFKVLIGYEGVFNEWRVSSLSREEEDTAITNEIEQAQKMRNERVVELSNSITPPNFGEWENRILQYANVRSNDMATFPEFAKFLELMGQKSPNLSLTLLENHAETLARFIPSLLRPIYESPQKQRAEALMRRWIDSGSYLRQIVGIFSNMINWDIDLFKAVCAKAIEKEDLPALKQIIPVIADNYNPSRKDFVNTILPDSIRKLTSLGDYSGILNTWYIWFREEVNMIVQDMNTETVDSLLEYLIFVEEIGWEAETVLVAIAKQYSDKVIEFFGERLKQQQERSKRRSGYSAIPYQFHELQKVLSAVPEKLVDAVSQWFDDDEYEMFIYTGGKFLKNIFPDFSSERFKNKLIDFIRTGERDKQLIVLAVLRNYNGDPTTHSVCKELVKVLPADSDELAEVRRGLEGTGVVWGEYGFVEAYQRKKEEIAPWLSDDDEKIRGFAQQYNLHLDKLNDWSKKRADEDIELRKFKYSTDEDDSVSSGT
jgi:hypothetical protein